MKTKIPQLLLMLLPLAAIGLVSFYSVYSAETRSSKEMKFKFEDYDIKSPEIARAKLTQLFPKGSSLSEFQSAMEQSGVKCDVSDKLREEDGSESMFCYYLAGKNPFVKSRWVIRVKIGSDDKVEELSIKGGLIGT